MLYNKHTHTHKQFRIYLLSLRKPTRTQFMYSIDFPMVFSAIKLKTPTYIFSYMLFPFSTFCGRILTVNWWLYNFYIGITCNVVLDCMIFPYDRIRFASNHSIPIPWHTVAVSFILMISLDNYWAKLKGVWLSDNHRISSF